MCANLTPASEPPRNGKKGPAHRDVSIQLEDGRMVKGWYAEGTCQWYRVGGDCPDDPYNDKAYFPVDIVGWKELSSI